MISIPVTAILGAIKNVPKKTKQPYNSKQGCKITTLAVSPVNNHNRHKTNHKTMIYTHQGPPFNFLPSLSPHFLHISSMRV